MKEKTFIRRLNEQFDVSEGVTKMLTGAGLQSSECPWMETVRVEGGPEPSCIDVDWGPLAEPCHYRKTDGGVCQCFRGMSYDVDGLFVYCSAEDSDVRRTIEEIVSGLIQHLQDALTLKDEKGNDPMGLTEFEMKSMQLIAGANAEMLDES